MTFPIALPLLLYIVALVLFGIEAWRSKGLVPAGLFCVTLGLLLTGVLR